jgi:hypothetical protein
MKKLFPLLLLLYFKAFSQDSITNQSHRLSVDFFSWKLDNKRISNKQFRSEIYKVPVAIPYLKRSQTDLYIGLPLFVSGIVINEIVRRNEQRNPYSSYDHTSLKVASSALIAGGSILIIFFALNKRKAAKIYNNSF